MKICFPLALAAVAGAFTAVSADAALVAHYALGEDDPAAAAGNTANASATAAAGSDLTRFGDPAYTAVTGGAPGSTLGLVFDGDDYLHSDTAAPAFDPATQDLTLSAWVNPSAMDSYNFVASITTGGNSGVGILQTSGVWAIMRMGQSVQGGPAVVLNTWTHLELRYTAANTTSELYINGAATGATLVGSLGSSSQMTVGATILNNSTNFEGLFKGTIDEVTVTVVPEPGSLALLGLGGLIILRRRR